MDDIFTQCREGNAVAVRLWLDNTENDLNQGFGCFIWFSPQRALLSVVWILPTVNQDHGGYQHGYHSPCTFKCSKIIMKTEGKRKRDDHGFSPLHWACREGRCNVVDMLIMRGARINVMNRGDDTPLHLASSHGHHDIVTKCRITMAASRKASVASPQSTPEGNHLKSVGPKDWETRLAEVTLAFKGSVREAIDAALRPILKSMADITVFLNALKNEITDIVSSGSAYFASLAHQHTQRLRCWLRGSTIVRPPQRISMTTVWIELKRAEKLGQSLAKVPYKDSFWKGTTRTRPRNGTLNKHAGIDFKQLSLSNKINENHSGELWKGRWQGNDIVVKVLKVRDWTTRKSRDFNEEYPKLRIFSHPNVLPMLGACQSPPAPHPIIITHWMPYGSLYNVLHEGTNLAAINALVLYKECTGNTVTWRDFILQLALELLQEHFDKRHESRLVNAPQPSASAAATGSWNKRSCQIDFVVDQTQAVKFGLDIARGMAFLHTLEPLIPRHYLNSKSIMQELPLSPPPPRAEQQELPLSPPPPGAEQQEMPLSPPPLGAEQQEMPLSPTPPLLGAEQQELPLSPPPLGAEQQELPLSPPPPRAEQQELPLSPPPPGAEQQEMPLSPPPLGAEQQELPLPPPPPSAEGEYLLVPPQPPWEDCLPLPVPPAEGEYLLVPSQSLWENSLSLPAPPAEGECLLVPPQLPWEDCLPLPPPPSEGECLLVPSQAPWEDSLPLQPPPPEGEHLLVPSPPPWEDCLPLPSPPAEDEYLLVPPPPSWERPAPTLPRTAQGCLPRTAQGCLPRTAQGCLPRTDQGCHSHSAQGYHVWIALGCLLLRIAWGCLLLRIAWGCLLLRFCFS
ncbi:UNVERIFIED_CONTAM: hypothetical protein FKN15_007789 [Acipenser sinensis]